MNSRDRVLHLAHHGALADEYMPAAFFLHFPESAHAGQAAIDAHIEYFRATGNDLAKVQYEHNYPPLETISAPGDWSSMPSYGRDFYQDQIDVAAGVVRELKREAVVIVTLYSPFMFAEQTVGAELLARHLAEDAPAVKRGLEIIVQSMRHFIDGCIEAGVDGFYASTQGGEAGRLADPSIFDRYIKPTDLAVWDLFKDRTEINVLHVCDYVAPYRSFDRYTDYPGQIVSAPTELSDDARTRHISPSEVAELFGRPFLGGMQRLGVISTGSREAVVRDAQAVIAEGPAAMILGADCTLPPHTDRAKIAAATDVAHSRR